MGTMQEPERPWGLTSREWEVLDRIAVGETNAEIAEALVVSLETVKTHVRHILEKLTADTRREARRIYREYRSL